MGVSREEERDNHDPLDDPAVEEVVAALAEPHATAPPPALRDAVLAAARLARTPDVTLGELGIVATPVECYRTVSALLHGAIAQLPAGVWARQARPYRWSCHELMGHLLAVERYTSSLVGGPAFALEPGLEADHLAFGEATIADERGAAPDDTVGRWWTEATALAVRADALDDAAQQRVVSFNGVPMRVETLWKARSFELWAHMDDLCLAGGVDLVTPPAPVLRAMSTTSVQSLPLVLGFLGVTPEPTHVRIVLTGSGGGAFSLALGGATTEAPVGTTIVVDVVDYCRMAARRLERSAMHGQVHGDGRLAERLFDAAQALAI